MAGEASAQREKQDQSIKARKNELFVEEEVQTGPRKKLRDYLKDTPATPLSKNVKLSLWGSAVPVVLLFLAALLSGSRHSTAKAPEEMIIPPHAKPAPAVLTHRSDDKPSAPATDSKPGDRKDDTAANTDKPAQEKAKPKKKSGKKKVKKDAVVAQNTDGDKAEGDKPKGDEPKDKSDDNEKNNKSGDSKNKSKTGSKDKMGGADDAKSKSATPEKPKQRAAPIFKKKKPPNFSYPKREGEKKGEPKPDPDAGDGTP